MSVVSSVLLQMSVCEDAFDMALGPGGLLMLAAFLDGHGKRPLADLTDHMPCGKHPQTFVFGGGYNYFPEDEFAEFVMAIEWQCPENVVLVINPEEGPTRVWRPTT